MIERNKDFAAWLIDEIKRRDWSFRQFADRSGSTIATVSRVINRHQKPTGDFCRKTARALQLSPEIVFRKAGLLPAVSEQEESKEEMLWYWDHLTNDQRKMFLTQVRALAEEGAEYDVGDE